MPNTITLLPFSHSSSNLLYEKLNNFSSLIASFTTPPRAGVENWNILLHRPWGNIQGISMAIIHLHTLAIADPKLIGKKMNFVQKHPQYFTIVKLLLEKLYFHDYTSFILINFFTFPLLKSSNRLPQKSTISSNYQSHSFQKLPLTLGLVLWLSEGDQMPSDI